jgi:hypothetical protein
MRDKCFVGQGTPAMIATDTSWHVWTATIQESANKAILYKDGTKVGEWGLNPVSSGYTHLYMNLDPKFDLVYPATVTARVDYLYVDNGIKPPGISPPPPTQATITVRTWLDSAVLTGISVTVSKSGYYYETWTTDSTGKVTKTVDAGSYSFSASYESNVGTVSPANPLVANAGSTYTVDISWGTGGPPPDNNWWEILNNPVVKSILTMLGIGLAGISAIVAVGPFKKKTATPYGF